MSNNKHQEAPKWREYERFDPNPAEGRNFTLIVMNGCAYRDTMPDEFCGKALDLLNEVRTTIEDKTKWMPTDLDVSDPMDWKFVLAVDSLGNRTNPSCSTAIRFTLLGAIERAGRIHYTPDAMRIALNGMQLAIEDCIRLGNAHERFRIREQKESIVGIDEYIDDEMAREGHERCLAYLDSAIQHLESVMPKFYPTQD